jgi:hypothetical protein
MVARRMRRVPSDWRVMDNLTWHLMDKRKRRWLTLIGALVILLKIAALVGIAALVAHFVGFWWGVAFGVIAVTFFMLRLIAKMIVA